MLTEDGLRTAKGKALDDSVGCAELVEALKGEYVFDLYAVFTTQEEVGCAERMSRVTASTRISPSRWKAPCVTTCPRRRTAT